MKKYKHKATGDIVNNGFCDEGYYCTGEWRIPSGIVENSNDWHEVKNPILVSEDGVELYEGDNYYAVYSTWYFDKINLKYGNPIVFSHTKNFSSREAAEKYIDENKPVFSKKQINEAMQAKGVYSSAHWLIDGNDFKNILKL